MLLLIVGLIAVIVFFLASSLFELGARKSAGGVNSRVQRYAALREEAKQQGMTGAAMGAKGNAGEAKRPLRLMRMVRYFGGKAKKLPQAKTFELKMQQAGMPLLGSEFLVILAGISLISAILVLLLTRNVLQALMVGLLAGLMSMTYVNLRISRRRKAFEGQMGDALDMMANAMRSGFSFMQAVDMVATEMSPPISSEFAKLVGEMRLGLSTDEALNNLSRRIGSKDFDLVIIAVMIHRQVGGNLVQILDSIRTTITDRIKMKREINTLTAQGRMSGWIVGLLPIGLAIVLFMMSPGYLIPLFTEPLGIMAVGAGLCSELVGIYFIKKIVDIDA